MGILDSNVVRLGGSDALLAGQKTVASSGTPEPLAASTTCRAVTVQAKPSNIARVYLGNASAQYVELGPGDSITLPITDLALVYLAVDTDGEGVNYVGVA